MEPNTGQDTPSFGDLNRKGADHAPTKVGMNATNADLARGPWADERKINVTVTNSTGNLSLKNDTNRTGGTAESAAPLERITSKVRSDSVTERSSSQIY